MWTNGVEREAKVMAEGLGRGAQGELVEWRGEEVMVEEVGWELWMSGSGVDMDGKRRGFQGHSPLTLVSL